MANFINFKNIRIERQKYNNNLIFKLIKEENIDELIKISNKNELDRVLEETNLNIIELISLCKSNDIMNKIYLMEKENSMINPILIKRH